MDKNKEKIYIGVVIGLILVILAMSFFSNPSLSVKYSDEEVFKTQFVQFLAQNNILSMDSKSAMNTLNVDDLIGSCSGGIANYLVSEGIIDENNKDTLISSLKGEFDRTLRSGYKPGGLVRHCDIPGQQN